MSTAALLQDRLHDQIRHCGWVVAPPAALGSRPRSSRDDQEAKTRTEPRSNRALRTVDRWPTGR